MENRKWEFGLCAAFVSAVLRGVNGFERAKRLSIWNHV
jgi:hypothetical protein